MSVVMIEYTGPNKDRLRVVKHPVFLSKVYDFSGGPVAVEENDAKYLLATNPVSMRVVASGAVASPKTPVPEAAK